MPIADTWVVSKSNSIVGFIAIIGNEVGALFVEPEYHRQGYGKALMDKAQGLHPTLELDVFKENTIGRSFYDRYGFKLHSERVHEETGNIVLRLFYNS